MRLSREIRFALVSPDQVPDERPQNSWGGWPSTNLIVPRLVLRCEIEGAIDRKTGFLCNIKVIDDLLRSIVTGTLIPNFEQIQTAEALLQLAYLELINAWTHDSEVVALQLAVSPFLSYSISRELHPKDATMSSEMTTSNATTRIHLTEQFEFSAAHRLHCVELSDLENQTLFGKCNNPQGHGHNYVVEITVSRSVNPNDHGDLENGQVIGLDNFEGIVKRLVVDRLDHQHLNQDIEYFKDLNPTVENIAIAIYDWLSGQFGDVKLESVRLYETPKTWAEYRG